MSELSQAFITTASSSIHHYKKSNLKYGSRKVGGSMTMVQSDLQSVLQIASNFCYLNPIPLSSKPESHIAVYGGNATRMESLRLRLGPRVKAFSSVESEVVTHRTTKPSVCTADELHYVSTPNSEWKLALWRYIPSPKAPPRNHPLLLLSGVGTNAIGYDLSPESSFARYMASQGFDTWILEVRGAGLSKQKQDRTVNPIVLVDSKITAIKGNRKETIRDDSQLVEKLTETFTRLSERLSGFLNEGLLEARKNSAISSHIKDLSQRLVNIIGEGQRSVSPQLFDLHERFWTMIEDFQKQLDLIVKFDWDFDNYLEEDVPTAMEYVRAQSKSKDGKLLAVGHSMGGILLYAMLSRSGFERRDSGLAAVVTLASSLDYTPSRSSLKLLLPLADPAQALNVPVIPLGALLAAAYPLSCHPPYVLSWLNAQISAEDMMHPELFEKLVLNNFCTVPAKLLLQLTTAFQEGGLRDRSGTFFYKDHLHKSNVPVLAFAGDQDLICPPEAVYETAMIIPQHLVTYKRLGQVGGPHYAHYDLVGGRLAVEQVYPCIIKFLSRHDVT
ncbi:PREDICTED: uncharacterized protein LOC104603357 isoform X2 [Nelumbo nucifera]|uniref:Uncharacterized protein LOC104603357 isoform X2 n=1 Tax=Nelumbo nucifera TaxID=4432 RepID=A0A1U8AU51_NELNU|nr:PREDICTED: uncharacterized protein LOC104603357 isoform X2 [Nelumbo nucifera]